MTGDAPRPIDVQPVVLEGEHVRLEPLTLAHLDGVMSAGADDAIWTWMPWHPKTRDEFAAFIATMTSAGLSFAIVERATGEVIGSTTYLNISAENRRLEIGGTFVAKRMQRTAVNTECKYLLLRHAFETLGCVRVELKTDLRNTVSQRAMERLGAVREGVHRKHQLSQHGFQRDSVYYSFIDDEWPALRTKLEAMLARA